MSAFYNKPWASGYSLPSYLNKEDPLTRGSAVVTAWLPRGTISKVDGLDRRTAGYALPSYVLKEPVGSQAHTTPWIPRGTVMSTKGIKTGLPWKSSAHTLNSNGLGSLGATPDKANKATVGSADPIVEYGKKASAAILHALSELPPKERGEALKKIMDEVDPKLYPLFKKEIKKAEASGASKQAAMQLGIAAAFQKGFVGELIRIGKKKAAPKPGTRKGSVPLGAATGFEAQVNNYQGLGGITSTIKNTVSKLGGYACDVATHPATPLAAGTAGAVAGGPAVASTAVAGAGIAATVCSSGRGGAALAPTAPQGMPSWALPAIIGGGVLTLILVLK